MVIAAWCKMSSVPTNKAPCCSWRLHSYFHYSVNNSSDEVLYIAVRKCYFLAVGSMGQWSEVLQSVWGHQYWLLFSALLNLSHNQSTVIMTNVNPKHSFCFLFVLATYCCLEICLPGKSLDENHHLLYLKKIPMLWMTSPTTCLNHFELYGWSLSVPALCFSPCGFKSHHS